MNLYRLRIYDTEDSNKYAASDRYNIIGGKASIWYMWYVLARQLGKKHVEIYTLDGTRCDPTKGILEGMEEHNDLMFE